jgi:hypothetical protein
MDQPPYRIPERDLDPPEPREREDSGDAMDRAYDRHRYDEPVAYQLEPVIEISPLEVIMLEEVPGLYDGLPELLANDLRELKRRTVL